MCGPDSIWGAPCVPTKKARVLATTDSIFEQSQDAFDKKKATHSESGSQSKNAYREVEHCWPLFT